MPDLLPMEGRSPGIHISQIIHYLCVKQGHYKDSGEGGGGAVDAVGMAYLQLGCALEWAVIERYARHTPDRYVQPGELELHGLFGTPDILDSVDWAIEDVKLTLLSVNHLPDSIKLWKYWVQVKAYCYMIGAVIGRLHVVHIRGNYRDVPFPQYRLWEQKFTRSELAENWMMLKSHAKVAVNKKSRVLIDAPKDRFEIAATASKALRAVKYKRTVAA